MIKQVTLLQSSAKARKESGLFAAEGLRLLDDAAENGIRFEKLILSQTALEKYREKAALLMRNAAERFVVPDSLFTRLSDTKNPQGICAVCAIPEQDARQIDREGRYVALENVADPSNLGAIARTAEALGASGLIVSGDGCDPYSPKALRASMGTLLRLPLFVREDFVSFLPSLGLTLYACVVEATAEKISEVSLGAGCAVIIGNEANGITPALRERADRLVTIPMKGRAESLNAAAAAAIAVWEMMK